MKAEVKVKKANVLLRVISIGLLSFSLIPQVTAKELNLYYQEKVRPIVGELIETTHPKLNLTDIQFSYHEIKSPAYFFESNFGMGRVILGKNHYKIGVNPLVFEKEIPRDALKGVLAHELVHTEDYVSGSTLGTILPIGVKLLNKKSKRQYERKTDLKVILKGLYNELLAYKKWQYPLLSPKDLEKKKLEYLTPEEIELIVENKDRYPQMILRWLKLEVPTNIHDLNLELQYYGNEFRESFFDVVINRKRQRRSARRVHSLKKYLSIEILSKDFHYSNCKLDVYPRGKHGYYFSSKKSYRVSKLTPKRGVKKTINFSKNVYSADFRLYDCDDMEGNGIYFSGRN